MITELYSVRSDQKEIDLISKNIIYITNKLYECTDIRMSVKTEINSNPKKIKTAVLDSLKNKNKPDFVIFANALDTEDSSSFRRLFTPLIESAEYKYRNDFEDTKSGTLMHHHIKVYPLPDPSSGFSSYCFIINGTKFLVMPRITLVGGSFTQFLCDTVKRSADVFDAILEECPDGFCIAPMQAAAKGLSVNSSAKSEDKQNDDISHVFSLESADHTGVGTDKDDQSNDRDTDTDTDKTVKKQSKFKKFLWSFIPRKGDNAKSIIIKIIVLIAVCVFLVSAGILLDFYVIEPWKNNSVMSDIQDVFYSSVVVPVTDENGNTLPETIVTKNWAGLEKINKEIVGWIKVNNTKVDYPVLYHKGDNIDSQFYLYRNYKKEYSDFGSIFLDYRCTKGVESKNVILHGHNMGSDDSMFGSLMVYARADGWVQGNTKFYKSSPVIYFDTPKANGEWIIFSVMKIDVSNDNKAIFNYLMGEFNSDAQFMNFIYNVKERSYLSVDVPINENDRIITLSTCSYESDNMRTVIMGRRLREGESYDDYVSTVKKHTPSSTVTSSFSEEYKNGNIKWYDGKGDLSGDETLNYLEQADMYKVTFIGGDGKEFAKQYVIKGKDATTPTEEPRKASDGTYYYTFKGWDTSLKSITKDTIIKALFTKHKLNIAVPTTTRVTEPEDIVVPPTPTQAPTQKPTKKPTQKPTEAVTDAEIPPTVITEPPAATDPVEASSGQ